MCLRMDVLCFGVEKEGQKERNIDIIGFAERELGPS